MMTPEEHQLMLLMFSRLYEGLEAMRNTFKRDGLWTGDDEKAFAHAAHYDPQKLMRSLGEAAVDYARLASALKIEVPPEIAAFARPAPTKPPNSEES